MPACGPALSKWHCHGRPRLQLVRSLQGVEGDGHPVGQAASSRAFSVLPEEGEAVCLLLL